MRQPMSSIRSIGYAKHLSSIVTGCIFTLRLGHRRIHSLQTPCPCCPLNCNLGMVHRCTPDCSLRFTG